MVEPTIKELQDLALLLQCLRDHVTTAFPGMHTSLFVSEAGLRRGLAISRSELPRTFVLLSTSTGALSPEQAEMVKDALLMYLGVDGPEHKPCMDFVAPRADDPEAWMDVLASVMSKFNMTFARSTSDTN